MARLQNHYLPGILVCLALLGCGPAEPIKIGMVAGLSGRMSQLGVSARNAVHLAIDQVNAQGGIKGRPLELIVRDNQGDADLCGLAVQDLAGQGVAGIIGPLMSKMAKPVLAAQALTPVLVISPTISTDSIKDLDDLFLRTMPVASHEARLIAQDVAQKGFLRVGVVYDASNRAYTEPIYRLFKALHEEAGGQIPFASDMGDPSHDKFQQLAQGIIQADLDALYLIVSGIDAAVLTQLIRKQTSAIQFYGAFWVKTGNLIQEAGRSADGMIIASPFERKVKTQAFEAFAEDYRRTFNEEPGFVAVYAFEAAQILFQGLRTAEALTPEQVKKAILDQRTFEGLEETFEINPFGDAQRQMMMLTVENGKFQGTSQ